jgi:aminoglycoside phosphotransferase (APT) family kinase protein
MEHIEGRIEMDARLPTMSPTDRGAVFDQMNATIAKLHAVDIASVGLANYGKPENFLERQIALWTQQYKAAQTVDITAMDRLMTWLPNNRPPRSNVSLFHGDFRLDNMILHPREPVVQAVIDWELSTLGDPLADLAYNALIWHIPPDLFRGLKGSSIAGIPSEDDYLSAYCRRLGRSEIAHWPFYLAFSLFRITAIVQGIAKRAQDATANADDAAELGKRAAPLAEIGWSLASR